jgi:hypothetical protein
MKEGDERAKDKDRTLPKTFNRSAFRLLPQKTIFAG